MRVLLFLLISLTAIPAMGLVCEGDLSVNNVGETYTEGARIELTKDGKANYTGPHASIYLNETVELEFVSKVQGWFLADLSSVGHGSEHNLFWYKKTGNQSIQFVYQGNYGYRVEGELNCKGRL